MAGKVGSFITSSIGTMRVTEQIDALEVMGINSFNYLIFPKITISFRNMTIQTIHVPVPETTFHFYY